MVEFEMDSQGQAIGESSGNYDTFQGCCIFLWPLYDKEAVSGDCAGLEVAFHISPVGDFFRGVCSLL